MLHTNEIATETGVRCPGFVSYPPVPFDTKFLVPLARTMQDFPFGIPASRMFGLLVVMAFSLLVLFDRISDCVSYRSVEISSVTSSAVHKWP